MAKHNELVAIRLNKLLQSFLRSEASKLNITQSELIRRWIVDRALALYPGSRVEFTESV